MNDSSVSALKIGKESTITKKKDTFDWVVANQEQIKEFAKRYLYDTSYNTEDAIQTAYCCAMDALKLMAQKNGRMNFDQCFYGICKYQLMSYRHHRAKSLDHLPATVISISASVKHPYQDPPQPPADRSDDKFAANMRRLTRMQKKIAGLVVQGEKQEQIAKELGLAESTIRVHMMYMMKRLQRTANQR